MKTYLVKKVSDDCVNWNEVSAAKIIKCAWPFGFCPEAFAQMVFTGEKFILKMSCKEEKPLARYKEYNEPMYTDSCMEFFCDWGNTGKYINMEMNSLGGLLSHLGPDRYDRTPVKDLLGHFFKVTPSREGAYWCVKAEIPVADICALYGIKPDVFVPGYSFRANFYKCGDETPEEHYGSWSPVETEKPDFHVSEFFGKLTLE